MDKPVSVIIPCRNEEKYIGNCLETILKSNYDLSLIEIIIVDGMSTDKTVEEVAKFKNKFRKFKIIMNEKQVTPVAFNLGIINSSCDYIMIVGAHTTIDSNYIKKLVYYLEKLDADLVGGTAKIKVKNKNRKTIAIASILSSPYGAGNAKTRIGVTKPTKSDAATGLYRKKIFDRVGLFNESLIRNQDMEHYSRIIRNGGNIYVIPDVSYEYYARETYTELATQAYRNGIWNFLTVFYTKRLDSLKMRHVAPLGFLLALTIPFLMSSIWSPLIYLSLFAFLFHLIVIVIVSVRLSNTETSLIHLLCAFYVLHLSYGAGSLIGILKVIRLNFQKREKKEKWNYNDGH